MLLMNIDYRGNSGRISIWFSANEKQAIKAIISDVLVVVSKLNICQINEAFCVILECTYITQ